MGAGKQLTTPKSLDEAHISVRFKHGVHIIYLYVDSLGTMATVGKELRSVLRERYPDGLTASLDPPKATAIPDETTNPSMAYGVLNNSKDPASGWKRLKIKDEASTSPTDAGLKQNSIVAFAFLENPDDEAVFEVEWPREEDLDEEEE